jgi:hypothetical protein
VTLVLTRGVGNGKEIVGNRPQGSSGLNRLPFCVVPLATALVPLLAAITGEKETMVWSSFEVSNFKEGISF